MVQEWFGMKRYLVAAIFLGFGCGLVPASALLGVTPAEQSDGWEPLFDGATLNGWRGFKSEVPGKGWMAANGELATPGHIGDLVTVGEFGDFELSLEWKVSKGTNSGIIYRVGLGEGGTYETGPEYQLLDNANSPENDGLHSAGSLYDIVAPNGDYTKPFGQWNQARIVVRGWKIEHWLNGEKIVDVDLASPKGKELVAHSKFRMMPKFASLLRGHIALQDHGGFVSFRHIMVRELS